MNNSTYPYFQSNYKYDYQFELDLMKRNQKDILYGLDPRYIKGEEPRLTEVF